MENHTSSKTFNFGADPDPDPGILAEFLPLRDKANVRFLRPTL